MKSFRVLLFFILLFLSFFIPYWLFFICVFFVSLFFESYWEVILLGLILDIVYVYKGVSFEAWYLVWSTGIYIISWLVHSLTRFYSEVKR